MSSRNPAILPHSSRAGKRDACKLVPFWPTQRSAFDGAGRDVMDYTTDGGAVNNGGTPLMDYADAASVTNDVVVSQTQNVLDPDADAIESIESDLLPNTTPAPTPTPTAGDAGFEYPDTYGGYTYNPAPDSSNPWTFSGDSGVAGNGSGFTSGNPDAPEGSQVAFIQQASGDISQSVTFAAGTFTLTFSAAQRSGDDQDFQVLLDGTPIDTVTPADVSYADYTTPSFTVNAGSHTIEFQGLDTAGGDNTAFIDNVRFKAAVTSASRPPW
jgi:hypothetical protein